jgi:hypothetical protein
LAKEGTAQREDPRRRILVGAIVLARVDQGLLEESVLRGWLDGAVTREEDQGSLRLLAISNGLL